MCRCDWPSLTMHKGVEKTQKEVSYRGRVPENCLATSSVFCFQARFQAPYYQNGRAVDWMGVSVGTGFSGGMRQGAFSWYSFQLCPNNTHLLTSLHTRAESRSVERCGKIKRCKPQRFEETKEGNR